MKQTQVSRVAMPTESITTVDEPLCGAMMDLFSCGGYPQDVNFSYKPTLDQLSTDELLDIVAFPENYLFQIRPMELREPAEHTTLPQMFEEREQNVEHNMMDVVKGFFGFSTEPEKPTNVSGKSLERRLTREEIIYIMMQQELRAHVQVWKSTVKAFKEPSTLENVMAFLSPPEKQLVFEGQQPQQEISVESSGKPSLFGGFAKPLSTSTENGSKSQVLRKVDNRDLLDDIFEGRLLPCGVSKSPVIENKSNVKRLPAIHDQRDLLDDIFEGRVFSNESKTRRLNSQPKNATPPDKGNSQSLRRFDERDLLDDVFEGRILPCGVPGQTAMNSSDQPKRLSLLHNDRDLLDDIFEGKVFSSGNHTKRSTSQPKTSSQAMSNVDEMMDLVAFPERLCNRESFSPKMQQVKQNAKEKDLLKTFFESLLSAYKTKTDVEGQTVVTQPKQSQHMFEQRDLLDDVFEGRLVSGMTRGSGSEQIAKLIPEKDTLDHVFDSVERQLCGTQMPTNVKSFYQGKVHRSLIDDVSTVSSASHMSRQGLGIFSNGEGHHNKNENIKQKKNIIQNFFSTTGK